MQSPDTKRGGLDPKLQAMLAEQRRAEVAAETCTRLFKIWILTPGILALTVVSVMMCLSDDTTTFMIGQTLLSGVLFLLWKLRKQISATLGM